MKPCVPTPVRAEPFKLRLIFFQPVQPYCRQTSPAQGAVEWKEPPPFHHRRRPMVTVYPRCASTVQLGMKRVSLSPPACAPLLNNNFLIVRFSCWREPTVICHMNLFYDISTTDHKQICLWWACQTQVKLYTKARAKSNSYKSIHLCVQSQHIQNSSKYNPHYIKTQYGFAGLTVAYRDLILCLLIHM